MIAHCSSLTNFFGNGCLTLLVLTLAKYAINTWLLFKLHIVYMLVTDEVWFHRVVRVTTLQD